MTKNIYSTLRFAQHFSQLLNLPSGATDHQALNSIVQRPKILELDVNATKENKAPGVCGIPTEIWKYGGMKPKSELYKLVLKIWNNQDVPLDWKDANIISLFKKGSRKECGNY